MYNQNPELVAAIAKALLKENPETPLRPRLNHPQVKFEDPSVSKVVAQLDSYKSGTYTKLGRNLLRIEEITEELKILRDEVKQAAREDIAELFALEDAAKTRVVETVSFTFTLSKNPKPTESYKYVQIIEELSVVLTPELIQVLEALKTKYKTVTQKEPSLKAKSLTNENVFDKLKNFAFKFRRWLSSYDRRLNVLKSMVR